MDSCIIPVSDNLYLIQTTDFFTPLVDDPYLNGRISACNVLSDLYACGTPKCDNILMLLGSSVKFSEKERDTVMPLMIQGFNECCVEAGTKIRGGHTLLNPWPLIGGAATVVTSDFIPPTKAKVGDKILLTKPLGTQIAVNMFQWRDLGAKRFTDLPKQLQECTDKLYQNACVSMATLNQKGAEAMVKFDAHCATDITGFGILGHADNLAQAQITDDLFFAIDSLPILKYAVEIDEKCNNMFKLLAGYSAETSGGLLVCLDPLQVDGFCDFLETETNIRPWVVGTVLEKSVDGLKAGITEDVKITEVENLKY